MKAAFIRGAAILLARPLTRRDPLRTADAIVVPGARIRPDGSLSRSAAERVEAGCALHAAGWAPWLVLSGGSPKGGGFVEAETMGAEARRRGVDPSALLLECHSLDTWQNAEHCSALLRARGLDSAIVVTHAFHTRRITRAFLRRGVRASAFPVDRSWMETGEPEALGVIAREYLALIVDLAGARR